MFVKSHTKAVVALLVALAGQCAWAAADRLPATGAVAASANVQPPATESLEEVTVTAQRATLADRLTTFVSKITGRQFDGGLALWGQPVCPLVSGLDHEESEFIVGRVSDIARAGRVPLAGGNCHPNLYILVTMHPQELLKGMMAKQNFRFTFGISIDPMDGTPIVASHIVIDDFISKPGPVRVLYRDEPIPASGVRPTVHAAKVGPITYSGDAWAEDTSWYLFRVFVIVDASQLKGVALGQLADYAALVGLSEIKPVDSLADAPTILQLFNGPNAAPDGMTEWDRAFLKSLYMTPPAQAFAAAMACRAPNGVGTQTLNLPPPPNRPLPILEGCCWRRSRMGQFSTFQPWPSAGCMREPIPVLRARGIGMRKSDYLKAAIRGFDGITSNAPASSSIGPAR